MLQISCQVFGFVDAFFTYEIAPGDGGWRASLRVDVCARSGERGGDGEELRLIVIGEVDELPAPDRLPGASMRLDTCAEWEEAAGVLLCDGRHQFVDDLSVHFGAWVGDEIEILLRGRVDLRAGGGRVQRNLPVRVSPRLRFDGVVVDEGWLDKAEARLAQFFDRARFEDPVKREDGAHVFRRRLAP